MKKSHFAALVSGVIGTLFFGVGMCMCLLPEWNLFYEGVALGIIGLIILLITVFIYRKIEHKSLIHVTGKGILTVILSILGTLALGLGMCLTMIYHQFILGIIIGISGIVLLLFLIPLSKGLK